MKKTRFTRALSFALCLVLFAAMALTATGCKEQANTVEKPQASQTASSAETGESTLPAETSFQSEVKVLGEGAKSFTFTVTDSEGKQTSFQIKTDKSKVGEALQELKLIEGEEGPYGLYVKTVNGIRADYELDGKYWAFYINGQMAMSGVDTTDIVEGAAYSFKAE